MDNIQEAQRLPHTNNKVRGELGRRDLNIGSTVEKLKPEEWTNYWDMGTTTTLNSFTSNNYDLQIYDFWKQQLQGKHKHIVDLACGNGALAWIAHEILNHQLPPSTEPTRITGVDIADIKPFQRLKKNKKNYPELNFIPNTSIESLPFVDGGIDVVISQYGLEYADFNKTIPEISRIIGDRGKICLIMHDVNSDILKGSTPAIEICEYLLNEKKIHAKYLRLDEIYNGASNINTIKEDLEVQNIWGEINATLFYAELKLKNLAGAKLGDNSQSLDKYIADVAGLFTQEKPNKNRKRKKLVAAEKQNLNQYIGRLKDLTSAALTEQEMGEVISLVEDQSFKITQQGKLAYKDSSNWGNILVAKK